MVITHHYLWSLLFVSKFKSSCHGHHNSMSYSIAVCLAVCIVCQLAKLQFKRRRIVEIQHGRVSWRWHGHGIRNHGDLGENLGKWEGKVGKNVEKRDVWKCHIEFQLFFLRIMNDWDEQWDVDSLSQAGQNPQRKTNTWLGWTAGF